MSGEEHDDRLLDQLGEEARARAAAVERTGDRQSRAAQAAGADRILAALATKQADTNAKANASTSTNDTIRRGRGAWWAAAVMPLAAAAAVALVLRGNAHEPFAPEYVASVTGHITTERGGREAALTTLQAADGALEQVIVRPREAAKGPIAAKVLVVRAAGVSEAPFPVEVSERGVVRFDAPGEALRGASEVRVVIASPSAMNDAVNDAVNDAEHPGAPPALHDAVVVRVPVEPYRVRQ